MSYAPYAAIALIFFSFSPCSSGESIPKEDEFGAPSLFYGGFEMDVALNRSTGLDLTHEEKLEWQAIRKSFGETQGVQAENDFMRSAVRGFLKGIGKSPAVLDRAVSHWWFEQYRPDLALDWHDVELTALQRKRLQKLKLSRKEAVQLRIDRLRILGELLDRATRRDVGQAIGKPYIFVLPTLKQKGIADFEDIPNCEPLAVLSSPFVQSELQCSKSQVDLIIAMGKEFRKKGYWISIDKVSGDELFQEEELEAIRKDAISRTEALLDVKQRKRFRELVLQRYLKWDPTIGPFYALEYLDGNRTEEFNMAVDQASVELLAAHRLRFMSFMKPKVQSIVPEADIDRLVGKADYMSDMSMQKKPRLDSSVVRKLIHANRPRNPRRRRSR